MLPGPPSGSDAIPIPSASESNDDSVDASKEVDISKIVNIPLVYTNQAGSARLRGPIDVALL